MTLGVEVATQSLGEFQVAIDVECVKNNKGAIVESENDPSTNVQLVTYDADPAYTGGYKFGYYDEANTTTRYQATALGNDDYWRLYKVTLTLQLKVINGVTYNPADIYPMVEGSTFTLTVEKDGSGSCAKVLAAESSTAGIASGYATSATLQSSIAFNSTNMAKVYYFGMYADGEAHNTAHAASPTDTANIKVTFDWSAAA